MASFAPRIRLVRATVGATRIDILLSESVVAEGQDRVLTREVEVYLPRGPLAEAAMEGRLPRGFCIKRLTDLPMLWFEQWGAIGLPRLRPLHLVVRETEFCGLRLAGDFGRRTAKTVGIRFADRDTPR